MAAPWAAAVESVLALLSDDGVVVAWTQGAEELVGLSADDVIGRRAGFFLGPDRGLTVSAFAERTGSAQGWSGNMQTTDGETRELRLSRMSGHGGAVSWMLNPPLPSAGRGPGAHPGGDPAQVSVWVNDVLDELDTTPRGRRLGHRITQVSPGFDAEALEAVMRSVLRTGGPAIDYRYRALSATDPSRTRLFVVFLFRLDAADGTPLGVASLGMDVTREQRRRERLAVLGEASSRIGTTSDITRTAQELTDFAVPLIADYSTVDLAESVRLGQEPLALLSPDAGRIPVFHRAGVASIHAGLPEALWKHGEAVFVPTSSPFTEVLTTGRSHFEPVLDLAFDPWIDVDPERSRIARVTGMHSLMIVPIRDGDAMLGIALFVRSENPEPFDRDDLRLAEELVAQTARVLNLQRTYAHEHATALALQRNLLPHRLTGGPGVEVASRYEPADVEDGVGGDWFDVIAMGQSRTALVVGDVVGHGISAAAAMGRLRTAVRTLTRMYVEPDRLLCRLDEAAMSFAEGDALDESSTSAMAGATCLIIVYDPRTHRASAAGAGHPPPVFASPEGAVAFPEIPNGAPLGYGLSGYESTELEIAEGSLIALYTDGLVETRGSDIDVGMARLAEALAQPGLSLSELCRAAFDARPGDDRAARADLAGLLLREPTDDATLLLARISSA